MLGVENIRFSEHYNYVEYDKDKNLDKKIAKIIYSAESTIPSESANSIHVMKLSEAFADICEFELCIMNWAGKENTWEVFEKYDVEPFKIHQFKIANRKYLLFLSNEKIHLLNLYRLALFTAFRAKIKKCDLIVTRDPLTAYFAVKLKIKTVLDVHGMFEAHYSGKAYSCIYKKSFLNNSDLKIVTITEELGKQFVAKYGLEKTVRVLPDGVSIKQFAKSYISNRPIHYIGYMGKFSVGKGVVRAVKLANKFPELQFDLYGGNHDQLVHCMDEVGLKIDIPDNIVIHGYVDNSQIPFAMEHCDVLLLPNEEYQFCDGDDIGKVTSPLKMFEYMASCRPILASDINVLKEVLNDSLCYFAKPDDDIAWEDALNRMINNGDECREKVKNALEEVKKYDWKARAIGMLEV